MLFTHITPESPCCLIESLACGTPIIGYESQFSWDLVKDFGGGKFVAVNDFQQLGELLVSLDRDWAKPSACRRMPKGRICDEPKAPLRDRTQLSQLIQQAGKNGSRFHDQAVFLERSNLIKKFVTVPTSVTTHEVAQSKTLQYLR